MADFCRRWGANYKYMVVMDADSVMSGDCLQTLVRLMEKHPTAGILQSAFVKRVSAYVIGSKVEAKIDGLPLLLKIPDYSKTFQSVQAAGQNLRQASQDPASFDPDKLGSAL